MRTYTPPPGSAQHALASGAASQAAPWILQGSRQHHRFLGARHAGSTWMTRAWTTVKMPPRPTALGTAPLLPQGPPSSSPALGRRVRELLENPAKTVPPAGGENGRNGRKPASLEPVRADARPHFGSRIRTRHAGCRGPFSAEQPSSPLRPRCKGKCSVGDEDGVGHRAGDAEVDDAGKRCLVRAAAARWRF